MGSDRMRKWNWITTRSHCYWHKTFPKKTFRWSMQKIWVLKCSFKRRNHKAVHSCYTRGKPPIPKWDCKTAQTESEWSTEWQWWNHAKNTVRSKVSASHSVENLPIWATVVVEISNCNRRRSSGRFSSSKTWHNLLNGSQALLVPREPLSMLVVVAHSHYHQFSTARKRQY